MRFDEHLNNWRAHRIFPAIHDELINLIATESEGVSFCDLGCCHGLLAQRLCKVFPQARIIGVEANADMITEAVSAGVTVPLFLFKLTRKTIPDFVELLKHHRIDSVIARRVMPEVWGDDLEGGKLFGRELAACGIKEIFLQGRAETVNATNALDSITKEVALFYDYYQTVLMTSQCARLAQ